MVDILEHLFGSRSRARMLRFFVLNPGKEISLAQLRTRLNIDGRRVRADVHMLRKIGFVTESTLKKEKIYVLDETFPYYVEMRNLFIKANTSPQCKELRKLEDVGRIKLILTSGIFLNYDKARVDILIVSDDINRQKLLKAIHAIEAEVGREVRYMAMTSEELNYRLNMMDRFLIDVLESPHNLVVNRIPKLQKFIVGLRT